MSIFWNAFLSTLSHAPVIEPNGVVDFVNQQVDSLPQPLHLRAAEFADSLYQGSRPLHEQAALFSEKVQTELPDSLKAMVCSLPQNESLPVNASEGHSRLGMHARTYQHGRALVCCMSGLHNLHELGLPHACQEPALVIMREYVSLVMLRRCRVAEGLL